MVTFIDYSWSSQAIWSCYISQENQITIDSFTQIIVSGSISINRIVLDSDTSSSSGSRSVDNKNQFSVNPNKFWRKIGTSIMKSWEQQYHLWFFEFVIVLFCSTCTACTKDFYWYSKLSIPCFIHDHTNLQQSKDIF